MFRSRSMILVLFLTFAGGCEERLPTAPPPPPPALPPSSLGSVFGIVTDQAGTCLVAATVELLDGPRAGERLQQSAVDCENFPESSVYAFIFRDLPKGDPVTLRASMTGFEPTTLRAAIDDCCTHHWSGAVRITLQRLPQKGGQS